MAASKKKTTKKPAQPSLVEFMQSMLAADPEKANEDWWTVEGAPEIQHLKANGYEVDGADERDTMWHKAEAGANSGDGQAPEPAAEASAADQNESQAQPEAPAAAAPATKDDAALEKRKPWMKPDYTGPLTANQAVERGRHLRMKGLRPDGRPLNATKQK